MCALGLLLVAYLYYPQIRGALPAVLPPSANVSELIDQNQTPFTLPQGFSISIYAKGLNDPRVLAFAPSGSLMVSLPKEGKIVSLPDEKTVVSGLNHPHGFTFRCVPNCVMYVAEENALDAYDFDDKTGVATNKKKLIDLPNGGEHITRTILFMPSPNDSTLLISIGSSCNDCRESDPERASIQAYDVNTGTLRPYATGLRNSVFMGIQPVNGQIWATDMGRDYLGDTTPPDEVNIIQDGKNYGWPICYGEKIHDTVFDKNIYIRDPCADTIPPHIALGAHVAPLGFAFIPEEGWPQDEWYNMLLAEHGSWNSTTPVGYKIVREKLDAQGNVLGSEDFMTGFLKSDGTAIGRPVDILAQPGGTLYISDDKAGVIYKVWRTNPL